MIPTNNASQSLAAFNERFPTFIPSWAVKRGLELTEVLAALQSKPFPELKIPVGSDLKFAGIVSQVLTFRLQKTGKPGLQQSGTWAAHQAIVDAIEAPHEAAA
jgi:hypothetical protein